MPKIVKAKKSAKSTAETPSADAGTFDLSKIASVEIPFIETDLPLADIVPVYNARSDFDPDYIKNELAPSIQEIGIQNRLWVYKLPEPINGANHGLIAGEQRWRASLLTTRMTAPVKIYDCTEQQAIKLGLIDNLQRRDLSDLDAAFAYRKLIDEHGMKAWDPANPEQSIGHQIKASKTKVYALLKLVELPKLGLEALRSKDPESRLDPSVAVRIARIPNRDHQMDALKLAISDQWTDADAAELINERYMTELKGAPFDRKDATLTERGSCESCPYRTGNMAEMFPDLAKGRGDVCTDTVCYREKCKASFKRRAAEHEKRGGKVLSKSEAAKAGLHETWSSVGGEYADLESSPWEVSGNKTWKQILKPQLDSGELIPDLAQANDGSGKHFLLVKRAQAVAFAKKNGDIKQRDGSDSEKAARKKEMDATRLALAVRRAQVNAIVDGFENIQIDDTKAVSTWMRGICVGFAGRVSHDQAREICKRRALEVQSTTYGQKLPRNAIDKLAGEQNTWEGIMALLVDVLICTEGWNSADDQIIYFASIVGVDLKQIEKGVKLAMSEKGKKKNSGVKQLELSAAGAKTKVPPRPPKADPTDETEWALDLDGNTLVCPFCSTARKETASEAWKDKPQTTTEIVSTCECGFAGSIPKPEEPVTV